MIDDQWIREKQAVCDKATLKDIAEVVRAAKCHGLTVMNHVNQADAEFILSARTDFPLALAELRRLREALAAVVEDLEHTITYPDEYYIKKWKLGSSLPAARAALGGR